MPSDGAAAGGGAARAALLAAAAAAAASSLLTYAALRARRPAAPADAWPAPPRTPWRPRRLPAAGGPAADGTCGADDFSDFAKISENAAPAAPDPFDPRPRADYLSWDDYFMAVAFLSAQRSKDPAKQVGACIVDGANVICGIGYNGFPRGCPDAALPWAKRAAGGDALRTKVRAGGFGCRAGRPLGAAGAGRRLNRIYKFRLRSKRALLLLRPPLLHSPLLNSPAFLNSHHPPAHPPTRAFLPPRSIRTSATRR
jgi:hypothetical protein